MDPLIGMSMVFTVVILALIGGFVLLYPVTRRLASVLEKRMLADKPAPDDEQVLALTRAVESLREQVERLGERQDFTEKLLEAPKHED